MQKLTNSLESLSLIPLEGKWDKLPVTTSTKRDERIFQAILGALAPHIGTKEEVETARKRGAAYFDISPTPHFFCQNEAEEIADLAAKAFSAPLPEKTFCYKRVYQIWKVVFPFDRKTFLLLPDKWTFRDSEGGSKYGRVALLCEQKASLFEWQTKVVFNLTNHKDNYTFINAREVEEQIYAAVGRDLFPKVLYDFESEEKRTVYYEWHRCLFYWSQTVSRTAPEVQKIALSLAQKMAYLHAKDITVIDLKSENMLLTAPKEVLLCDTDRFEISCAERRFDTHEGTLELDPPEFIVNKRTDSKASDRFLFGPFLLELLVNKLTPWEQNPHRRRFDSVMLDVYRSRAEQAIVTLQKPDISITRMLFCLAEWALHPDAAKRPTYPQICSYLEKTYSTDNDVPSEEVMSYFEIEKTTPLPKEEVA